MPPRMIRVRHKETGDERMLGESAFPYFAGIYERLDEPPADPGQAPPGEQPAAAPARSGGRRAATTNQEKEEG
jgi:hypothetical protein